MTEASRPLSAIMADRMALVMEIAQLTSEQQRLFQIAGGVEIEVMRHEEDVSRIGETDTLMGKLDDAFQRDKEAKASLIECERRLQEIEQQVADLDAEMASGQMD